ncbi:flagellar biosynthetic protein FliO [Marinilactibacillus sp. Marseille-P9653]|uniref:FliO/MopB family protein n=1 Tax=Marinilactibacillus sp. Marseille-P9653 TaxID=2866583 RepID=UPI001CE49AF7|nr:flagellar biosynthetic protein FliO [Marinilactibacillus sp. Marseille-P9653]
MPGASQFIQMVVALLFIIVLANYLLKKLNGLNQGKSKAIKIIERVPMSKNSSLCIVQVGSQYFLMSFSDQSSEVIKEFTQEEKEDIQQRIFQKNTVITEVADTKKFSGNLKELLEQLKSKYNDSFNKD